MLLLIWGIRVKRIYKEIYKANLAEKERKIKKNAHGKHGESIFLTFKKDFLAFFLTTFYMLLYIS